MHFSIKTWSNMMAQLAGAAEYTDCISAEGKNSPNECPGYVTKQSDGVASVMLELWRLQSTPFLAIASRSTLTWSGST